MAKVSKKKSGHVSVAVHARTPDGTNIVGIGNLRVIIVEEEGNFFAQALEIDYVAQGNSLAHVKKAFGRGLHATIREHLREYDGITKLLKPAPPEVIYELLMAGKKEPRKFTYDQVSFHRDLQQILPFGAIKFCVESKSAA